jgi:hypothetical protein
MQSSWNILEHWNRSWFSCFRTQANKRCKLVLWPDYNIYLDIPGKAGENHCKMTAANKLKVLVLFLLTISIGLVIPSTLASPMEDLRQAAVVPATSCVDPDYHFTVGGIWRHST